MRRAVIAIGMGLAVSLSACGTGAGSGSGGDHGPVVVVVRATIDDPEYDGLYGYDAEGRFVRRVSGAVGASWGTQAPHWNPDRSRLAFVEDKADVDHDQLFVVDPDAEDAPLALTPVPATPTGITILSWSPDGTSIALHADLDGDGEPSIHVVPAAGGAAVALSDDENYVYPFMQFWSPNSRYFSWCEADHVNDPLRLMVADLLLDTVTEVSGTMVAGGGVFPQQHRSPWAPSSARLAFLADKDVLDHREVWSVLPTGAGLVKLSTGLNVGQEAGAQEWSPDSTRVAYVVSTVTTRKLFSVPAAGGVVTPESATDERPEEFHWRPGTNEIAWSGMDTTLDVNVLRIRTAGTGGAVTTLYASPGPTVEVGETWRWSPDGARVAFRAGDADIYDPHMRLLCVDRAAPGVIADVVPEVTATGDVSQFAYRWSPDGTRLLAEAWETDTSPLQSYLWVAGDGTVQLSDLVDPVDGVSDARFSSTGQHTMWVEGWYEPAEVLSIAGPVADDPDVAVGPGPEIVSIHPR